MSVRPALPGRRPAGLATIVAIAALLGPLLPASIVFAADTTPPTVTTPVLSPNPAAPGVAVSVTATATDDVAVAAAQLSVDSGPWTAMSATDGAFGGTSEALTGSLGGSVVQVAAGGVHTCARVADTTVRCWGNNSDGQLGDGTTTTRLTPVAVTGLSGVRALATVGSHTCALLADTTVRCWGANFNGQLGDGTTTNRLTPVAVPGLAGVTALAAGNAHTCALLADTTVRCWGENTGGQLGDGTFTDRLTPVAVTGLSGVTVLAAGGLHTCALLADTTVRCWGNNAGGQLGDGTTTTRLTPVAVTGLSGVSALAGGYVYTCARVADTTVRCWGGNFNGQLGDGTTTARLTPVAVTGLSGVSALAAAYFHTCALLSDTTVRCWGLNADGQLGDGTTTTRLTPVAVTGLSGVTALAAGYSHTCARVADTTVRCWGSNSDGQLGDGTTTNRLSPVAVAGFGALSVGPHTVCVRATDSAGNTSDGTACADTVNERPTDITLSATSVDENQPSGTTVGTFSTTDPDPGDSFTYTLVTGTGGDNNAAFTIAGSTLKTNAVFIYATKTSYAIRVRTTDAGGLFFDKQFTITIRSPQIGTVDQVVGSVTIIHADGSTTTAVVGSPVAMGDVIQTSSAGAVSILLIDNSSLTISESARMLIDTFLYDPQAGSRTTFFSLFQGACVWISRFIGADPANNEQIETPVGAIGSRATELIARYDPGSGIAEADLILGKFTFTPLLSSVTSTFDAPMTIRFDASSVLSAEPLSQASYDAQKQAILSLFETTDTTAPTASPSQSPAVNGAGWNGTDVTVTWNWADEVGGSGVDAANCTTSSSSSGEGTVTLTATCNDLAGNTGSASHTSKIDKTFPTLAPIVNPNPVAVGGAATVTINASDTGGSGLAPALTGCGPLDTSTLGTRTVSCTATDNAGNDATASATYVVGYGFGGFRSPLTTSVLARSGSTIPVKFTLSNASGPLASALAASLATNHQVRAVLSGPGTSGPVRAVALCTWDATNLNFQCNIKTPKGLTTGGTNPYFITAQETLTPNGSSSSFFAVPDAVNPEIVYFK